MIFNFHKFAHSIFVLVNMFVASALVAQEQQYLLKKDISRDSLLILARMIIDSAQCRVFITVDESGKPQARQMSFFSPEVNMVIWLGTNPRSRKVQQI